MEYFKLKRTNIIGSCMISEQNRNVLIYWVFYFYMSSLSQRYKQSYIRTISHHYTNIREFQEIKQPQVAWTDQDWKKINWKVNADFSEQNENPKTEQAHLDR